jgi:HNH endonuclease
MKNYSSKRKICTVGNEQCGGTCINPRVKTCRLNTPEIKSAIQRLLDTKPRQLLKAAKAKGFGPVQYITQAEAMRSLAVYGSSASISDMKSGAASHPYIKINKIEQAAVDKYHDLLKAEKLAAKASGSKALTLYDRLTKAGIRGDNPKISTEDKVKIFIRLYMEQNGQSFATGNPVNLNRLVVDHVIPLSAGGKNSVENMVLIESNINYWKKAIPSQADLAQSLKNKIGLAVPAQTLEKLAKALAANSSESGKIKAEILALHKLQARTLDRQQSQQYRQGASNKASLLNSYSNLRWAKFNTITSLEGLNAKEARQLLKAQSTEAKTTRAWIKKIETREQVELAKTPVQKAQVFLTNGGKWKDLPQSWKDEFKLAYETNKHPKGTTAIFNQYGSLPDKPDWLVQ